MPRGYATMAGGWPNVSVSEQWQEVRRARRLGFKTIVSGGHFDFGTMAGSSTNALFESRNRTVGHASRFCQRSAGLPFKACLLIQRGRVYNERRRTNRKARGPKVVWHTPGGSGYVSGAKDGNALTKLGTRLAFKEKPARCHRLEARLVTNYMSLRLRCQDDVQTSAYGSTPARWQNIFARGSCPAKWLACCKKRRG